MSANEIAIRCATAFVALLALGGCQKRDTWLQAICARESGFEYSTGPATVHERIATDSVMLDRPVGMDDRGPVLTWMSDRGFPIVEIRDKPSSAPIESAVAAVDRYSIAEPARDCITDLRLDEKAIAALRLGSDRCVRIEKKVAPQARYLIGFETTDEPRTLGDRLYGLVAARHRYALVDRRTGRTLAQIESASYSGTRGMFSPRGNACSRGYELEMMKHVLRSPSDRLSWFEIMSR